MPLTTPSLLSTGTPPLRGDSKAGPPAREVGPLMFSHYRIPRLILERDCGARRNSGGERGIRTLDTGFGPYNGLANISTEKSKPNPERHLPCISFFMRSLRVVVSCTGMWQNARPCTTGAHKKATECYPSCWRVLCLALLSSLS